MMIYVHIYTYIHIYIYVPTLTRTDKKKGALENPMFSCKTRVFKTQKKIMG